MFIKIYYNANFFKFVLTTHFASLKQLLLIFKQINNSTIFNMYIKC